MSQSTTFQRHYTLLSCTNRLPEAATASSSTVLLSTISTRSLSTLSRLFSKIYISTLAAKTSSTVTALPTSKCLSRRQVSNGIANAVPPLSSATVAESSSQPSVDTSSLAHNQDQVIILVMMFFLVSLIISSICFYLVRRSRQRYLRRQQELEEGRKEVAEARAMWPSDQTLKRGSKTFRHVLPPSHVIVPGYLPPLAVVAPHSFYNHGIRRSQSLPRIRPTQYHLPRPATSYHHIVNDETEHLARPPSPFSLSSYYAKRASNPPTPLTTMQTRQSPTPEPVHFPVQYQRSTSPGSFASPQINSFWPRSTTASIATSPPPSIFSPTSTAMSRAHCSLRPPPVSPQYPPIIYSESQPSDSLGDPLEPPSCWHLDMDRDPTIYPNVQSLSQFHPNKVDPSVAAEAPQVPQYSPPTSPRHAPRPPTPILPRCPPSTIPDCACPECPFETMKLQAHIEQWLDSSTGHVPGFGSIIGMADLAAPKVEHVFVEEFTMSGDAASEKGSMQTTLRVEVAPRRISSIRGMRSPTVGSLPAPNTEHVRV